MKKLETKRLILRKFTTSDLHDFFEYAKLPSVGPNAGWTPHPNLEHSKKILDHFINGDDVWAIELKSEDKVIGSVGLHKSKISNYGEVFELGYVLSTLYENNGYMTEAVFRILEYSFIDMNLEKIYVAHFIENSKSQKLINRFKFSYLSDEDYVSNEFGIKRSRIYMMTNKDFKKLGGKI